MADKSWKAFERRIAKAVNGVRNPLTGERAAADVENENVMIQCKKGQRLPGYLLGWLAGITGFADRFGKMGIVVWALWRKPDDDSIVIARFGDIKQLLRDTVPYEGEAKR